MDRPAFVRLEQRPGRHIAVIGTNEDLARTVIRAAVTSLARQFADGAARFSIACLDEKSPGDALRLRRELGRTDVDIYDSGDLASLVKLTARAMNGPHFLAVYGLDVLSDSMPDQVADFRQILRHGPERGVHLIGWWRLASRFRELVDEYHGRRHHEVVSAMVLTGSPAQDIRFSDTRLISVPWEPRPHRALLIDLDHIPLYQTVIPYAPA